jgi:hypothetical protein
MTSIYVGKDDEQQGKNLSNSWHPEKSLLSDQPRREEADRFPISHACCFEWVTDSEITRRACIPNQNVVTSNFIIIIS